MTHEQCLQTEASGLGLLTAGTAAQISNCIDAPAERVGAEQAWEFSTMPASCNPADAWG